MNDIRLAPDPEDSKFPSYTWDQLRDITEASALFYNAMSFQGENLSSIGMGDSRNAPDVLVTVGLGWMKAVAEMDEKMDGEYIESLAEYVAHLSVLNPHKVFGMNIEDMKAVGIEAIQTIMDEWEEAHSTYMKENNCVQ